MQTVALTRARRDGRLPRGVELQDVSCFESSARTGQILTARNLSILRRHPGCDRLPVALYVLNDNPPGSL